MVTEGFNFCSATHIWTGYLPEEASVLITAWKHTDSPIFRVAISEHACLTKQNAVTTTCAVGAAGEGLFNRLVKSGEVGVGTTGFTSGPTSLVSSPVTCKYYVHNTGSLMCVRCNLSLSATTLLCVWAVSCVTYINMINEPIGSGNRRLSNKIMNLRYENSEQAFLCVLQLSR
jgi:hypothetical protein